MNYKKIYDSLIERGKTRILEEYTESHHIIPRCMGGDDSKDNLVDLTPEEHYLAHQLLVKIYPENRRLAIAASMMIPNRPSNKMYGWLKRRHSKAMSEVQNGSNNSQYGKIWISDGITEKKIPKSEMLPEGWKRSRLSSILTKKKKQEDRLKKEKEKASKKEAKLEELRRLYKIYITEGFEGVLKTGYTYSQQNLVTRFAKNLPEFVPQNGKKR